MLEKGKKVGEYVLLEKLGAGGFGDVWKAEKRTVLDVNHFALKFFRPKQDGVDFDKIGKELAVWKQLRGLPHIISVIELDRFEDYVYVVSDFADGGSLETWLSKNGKASTETEAVKIALEILTGLENLHGKGFVHRDLKPDNILIMNGRFCLADFGISREIKTHSKATGTAGTMEYMPPEAFEKTPSITQQTDIWAVGAILQRLLTGNLPYPQDEQPSLIAAILMSEPDEMPETVSQSLREIVKKSLQKNRENRFQSANEMREILRDVLMRQKFVESKTLLQTETLVREDSDKTKKLEIALTQDWREIEAEKEKRRLSELQETESKRQQGEIKRVQHRLSQRKSKAKSTLWEKVVGVLSVCVLVMFGLIGVDWFRGNGDSANNKADNIASNVKSNNSNVLNNKPANDVSNVANTSSGEISENSAIKLMDTSLPSGKKIQVYQGGIEDQLIKFIQSDDYKTATAETLKDKWFKFDDLNFKTGTVEIAFESQRQLDNIAAILKEFPNVKIKIGGYTDKKGNDAVNLMLSDGRAKAVKTALEKIGVAGQVPEAEGYGEQFATVAETATEAERQSDRRISIRLIK